MVKEVTRQIKSTVERELWARAAGRCQFSGCNKPLFISAVTHETVNLAQKAHIYSFSEKGPRGWGPFKIGLNGLNDISNLILVCHGCHSKIDQDNNGARYSAELLIKWKSEHEQRVEIVTGIAPDKKSHVVLYGANIGSEKSKIEYHACVEAMFPLLYPCSERPIKISTKFELKDNSPEYWHAESEHLYKAFERYISPLIAEDECQHYSIFALAPQPLLIQLGALLTDKTSSESYQLHREPRGWHWQDYQDDFDYIIKKPSQFNGPPALVFSLSDNVSSERVTSALGKDASIWEITITKPNNDFMQSKQQLSLFRKHLRNIIVEIKRVHGETTPLHIFPVMPVSCAIESGRIRMPKADMPWIIYDHNINSQEFVKAIELRGDSHDRR